ncbi:BCCT family transporter [Sporosarcina sp. YIM B06819]
MLFSTGMGIGHIFWGVAEPLSHIAIDSATEQTGHG